MASNQHEDVAAYVKQLMEQQQLQQQQQQQQQHEVQTAQHQHHDVLSQFQVGQARQTPNCNLLMPANEPQPQPQTAASLGQLILNLQQQQQQPQGGGGMIAATLPNSLLMTAQTPAAQAQGHPPNFFPEAQSQQCQQEQPASAEAPSGLAQSIVTQQQLLASAQLLSSVNPGLSDALTYQALEISKNSHQPTSQPPIQYHAAPSLIDQTFTAGRPSAASLRQQPQNQQPQNQLPQQLQPQQLQPQQLQSQPQQLQPQTMAQLPYSMLTGAVISNQIQQLEQYGGKAHGAQSNHLDRPSQSISAISQQGSAATAVTSKSAGSDISPAQALHSTKPGVGAEKNSAPNPPTPLIAGNQGQVLARESGETELAAANAGTKEKVTHHNSTINGAASDTIVESDKVQEVPVMTLHKWNLEQLEAHEKRLLEANQAIPKAVTLLLDSVRHREEKRQAKRLSNRRSASHARARKKAIVEELERDNAMLKRYSLILSYLPDPVMVVSTDGAITFCNKQMEQVLMYGSEDLIGANIEDIIVPSSRKSIRCLMRSLILAQRKAISWLGDTDTSGENESNNNSGEDRNGKIAAERMHDVSELSSENPFFPLLEVKVKSGQTSTEVAGEGLSDSSDDPPGGVKSAHGAAMKGSDSSDQEVRKESHRNEKRKPQNRDTPAKRVKASADENNQSGDSRDFTTSSDSKVSFSLPKNVEMCKLNQDKKARQIEQVRFSHKDDVMGASVTANNADAKLSSLMHQVSNKDKEDELLSSSSSAENNSSEEKKVAFVHQKHIIVTKSHIHSSLTATSSEESKEKKQNHKDSSEDSGYRESKSRSHSSLSADSSEKSKAKKQTDKDSSEDSGYRESNESPEESDECPVDGWSSSGGNRDQSSPDKKKGKRPRPLAPACYVRLICGDLSTIWCEITSSIRPRTLDDPEDALNFKHQSNLKQTGKRISESTENTPSYDSSDRDREEKELLICFRPIREGDKVGEELLFRPKVSESEHGECSPDGPTSSSGTEDPRENVANNTSIPMVRRESQSMSGPQVRRLRRQIHCPYFSNALNIVSPKKVSSEN